MIDLAAATSRLAHICSEGRRNECFPRIAAICAALAAIALAILGAIAGHSPAHADGGASARSKASASAPNDNGATMQDYTQRILRVLADRNANNWVRYWQARADCQTVPAAHDAAPLDRVLVALTAAICAQLDARLGVNPAAYSPRGEKRTVGLLVNEPDAAVGYTLFTGQDNSVVFLLDTLGRVAHSWRMPDKASHARLHDNGNLLVNMAPGIVELDPRGNKIWQYSVIGHHHDFFKMPNGNVLLLMHKLNTREEAIAAGANPEFVSEKDGLNYDYLLEVRPEGASGGEVVWEWSAWDHLVQDFDPSKPNYGAVADHPDLIDLNFLLETISMTRPDARHDWLHVNSVDYDPKLDWIMLSARNFSELWIIDRSTTTEEARGHSGGNSGMGGDLLYRWGNPRAYGQGDADDQRLFWQHQTHWIPPGLPGAGNILLFNNGLEFPDDERFYSSIDEFAPPADGYSRAPNSPYPPLAPEWTYAAETRSDFYAPIMSGTQRLPNGNTLAVDGPAGTIFQITRDGRIVWKYIVPLHERVHLRQGERAVEAEREFPTPYGDPIHLLTNNVYRAYWYPPDHPGLRALDLTPGAYVEDFPDTRYDARATLAAAAAGDFGDPLVQADESDGFKIYLDENAAEYRRRLLYIKQPCADEDDRVRFFLQVIPVDVSDLPAHRQGHGFITLDFSYESNEVRELDDLCIAIRHLPFYPIERIRTGELLGGFIQVWQVEIELDG